MISRMVRLLSIFMCLILVLTGCNAVGTGSNNSEDGSDKQAVSNVEDFSEEYIVLEKAKDKDFIVLNLADIQMTSAQWAEDHPLRKVIEYTVTELVKKTKPDLITLSGDNSFSGEFVAYTELANLIDSFGIPWAPVWGNHDNEGGISNVRFLETVWGKYENFIYDAGPGELGRGNYVISIEENGKPITGIFMMDTHDSVEPYTDALGVEHKPRELTEAQKLWYKERAESMKALGYKDSAIILHIPITSYNEAFYKAFNKKFNPNNVTWQDSSDDKYWNEGYEDSFGVCYDGIDIDLLFANDGVMDIIEKIGHTKYMIAGHDHGNNYVIKHRGMFHAFALKTGRGSYYYDELNGGGTVMRISSDGIAELYHEYINTDHIEAENSEYFENYQDRL